MKLKAFLKMRIALAGGHAHKCPYGGSGLLYHTQRVSRRLLR